MTAFNTMAVVPVATGNTPIHVVWQTAQNPIALAPTQIAPVWAPAHNPIALAPTQIAPVWPTVQNPLPLTAFTFIVNAIGAEAPQFQYSDGHTNGELYGFSSQREEDMEPVQLGETVDNKKTVSFRIWTDIGLPASGLPGDGNICSPAVGEIQVNRDLAGYVNATGTFSHIGDGVYRYTFPNSEVASGGGEGNTWLRVKVSGFRTVAFRVPIRSLPPTETAIVTAVLDAARSGHIGTGTIGEGVAAAMALLQGNFYMDQTTNTASGQTAARIRCFHTGAATSAATAGGSGEGEFATFLVTTAYSGASKITTHRVTQQ